MTHGRAWAPPTAIARDERGSEYASGSATRPASATRHASTVPPVAAVGADPCGPPLRPRFSIDGLPPPPPQEDAPEAAALSNQARAQAHARSRVRFVVAAAPMPASNPAPLASPTPSGTKKGQVRRRLFNVAAAAALQRGRGREAAAEQDTPASAPKRRRGSAPLFVVAEGAARGAATPPRRRRLGGPSFAVIGERADAGRAPSKTARVDAASFVIAGGCGRTQPELHAPAAAVAARRAGGPLQLAVQAARGEARRALAVLRAGVPHADDCDGAAALAGALAAGLALRVEHVAANGALLVGVVVASAEDGGVAAGDGVAVRADAEDESIGPGDFAVVPAPWTVLRREGGCMLPLEAEDDVEVVVLAPTVALFPSHLMDEAFMRTSAASSLNTRALARRPTVSDLPGPVGMEVTEASTFSDHAVRRHSSFSSILPCETVVELALRVVTWSADMNIAVVKDANDQFGLLKALPLELRHPGDSTSFLGCFEVAPDALPFTAFQTVMSQLEVTTDTNDGSRNSKQECAEHQFTVPVFVHLPRCP